MPHRFLKSAASVMFACSVALAAAPAAGALTPETIGDALSGRDPQTNRMVTSSTEQRDAQAPTGGAKIIVIGDSQTSGTSAVDYADERGCVHSAKSWPAQLRDQLGLPAEEVIDVSCSGSSLSSSGLHLSDQVRNAEARGALGERTEHILIQLGQNDPWGSNANLMIGLANCFTDVVNGCGDKLVQAGKVQNGDETTPEAYAALAKPVVDYLRYYAPGARIHLVSYQHMVPRSGSEICVSLGGFPVRKPDAPAIVHFLNRLDDAQRGAADILDVEFIDVRSATEGRDNCSGAPLLVGFFDPSALQSPISVWHPTVEGDYVTAATIRNHLSA